MTDPKVSVIIPVYNAEEYLRQCLSSVLNQSLREIEVICVDDGSTDSSAKILEEYASQDNRVKVIRQHNQYAGAARNKGIEAATGEYLHFLDADDYVLDAYEPIYNKAAENNLDCLKFGFVTFDEQQNAMLTKGRYSFKKVNEKYYNCLLTLEKKSPIYTMGVVPWNGLYRREFILERNIRFNSLICVNDRSFFNKIITNAGRVMLSPDILVVYRVNQEKSLVGKRAENFDCHFKSIRIISNQLVQDKVAPEAVQIIMGREFKDLRFWYGEFCNDEKYGGKIRHDVKDFIKNYDGLCPELLYKVFNGINVTPENNGSEKEFGDMEQFKFKFSIVMAVYNAEEYLPEAVESILQQDIGFKENVQLILVDDGSSDRSGAICDDYAEKYPGNIAVIHKENGGVASARNAGLAYAEGRYLNFMDSDDKITANALSEVYKFFVDHEEETDIVAIPIQFFDKKNTEHYLNYKFKKGDRIIDLQKEYDAVLRVVNASFFTHRCKSEICFDGRLFIAEDTKVVLSILCRKMKLGVVASCKYLYRRHTGDNLSIIDKSKNNHNLYFDYFTYFVDWSISFHKEKLGFVPGYVQYANMIEFAFRLKSKYDISQVLTAEEIEEYKKKLFGSFKYIDDIYILKQKIIGRDYKNFVLSKKYNRAPDIALCDNDAIVHYGDSVVCRISECYTRIEAIEHGKKAIYIKGFTRVLGVDDEEKIGIYVLCNNRKVKCKIEKRKKINTVRFGEVIYRGIGFECTIPLKEREGSIKIGITFRGIDIIKKNVNLGKEVPIDKNMEYSYYRDKWIMTTFRDNTLWWKRYTRQEIMKQEYLYLKELWDTGEDAAREEASARFLADLKEFFHKIVP